MKFLMLRKDSVPPKTSHLTLSLKHLIGVDEVPNNWIVIQIYGPEQDKVCRDWFGGYEKRAKDLDVETDIRRVLNHMVSLKLKDRLNFEIIDNVMSAQYDDGVLTDLDVAALILQLDDN